QDAREQRERSGEHESEHRKAIEVASDLRNSTNFLDDLGGASRKISAQSLQLFHRAPEVLERRDAVLRRVELGMIEIDFPKLHGGEHRIAVLNSVFLSPFQNGVLQCELWVVGAHASPGRIISRTALICSWNCRCQFLSR